MQAAPGSRRGPRALPLLVAVAISIANLFLHKPISDVLDGLYASVGRRWYEIISITAIGVMSVVASAPALRRLGTALTTTWLPFSLLCLALLTAASQRWLLVTNIELIHFPQFALISVLFLIAGAGAKLAWLLGSLAGLLDETYQYRVIYDGVPNTYFDINDILLNTIGAAWGTCLFGAGRLAEAGPTYPRGRTYAWLALLAALFVGTALYFDPPDQVLLRPAMTRKLYRVLSLGEGLAGIFAVTALVELASTTRGQSSRAEVDRNDTLVGQDR